MSKGVNVWPRLTGNRLWWWTTLRLCILLRLRGIGIESRCGVI